MKKWFFTLCFFVSAFVVMAKPVSAEEADTQRLHISATSQEELSSCTTYVYDSLPGSDEVVFVIAVTVTCECENPCALSDALALIVHIALNRKP